MGANGIIDLPGNHSVPETVERLQSLLNAKGIKVFARIDQAAEARAAGLTMRPMVLVIFGDPKAGTPLLSRYTSIAMDLPLKALVWEDTDGKVWVSYNTPEYLRERHGFPEELLANIAGIRVIVNEAVRV